MVPAVAGSSCIASNWLALNAARRCGKQHPAASAHPPASHHPTPVLSRIGQALLRGQWRDAVRQLLTPRADCTREDQVEAARLYLEEGDIEGALARMPRFLVAEPMVLQVGRRDRDRGGGT